MDPEIQNEIEDLKSKVDILLMVINEEVLKKRSCAIIWHDEYERYVASLPPEEEDEAE